MEEVVSSAFFNRNHKCSQCRLRIRRSYTDGENFFFLAERLGGKERDFYFDSFNYSIKLDPNYVNPTSIHDGSCIACLCSLESGSILSISLCYDKAI